MRCAYPPSALDTALSTRPLRGIPVPCPHSAIALGGLVSGLDAMIGSAYGTSTVRLQIVLDTNVLVAGLRSRRGASFLLLELVGTGRFDIHLSVPLVLEYEDALLRQVAEERVDRGVMEAVLDFHCAVAQRHSIFFLWRPLLGDPRDDMVLELAVKAQCDYIITFNERDFVGVERFGIEAVGPVAFLKHMGVLS